MIGLLDDSFFVLSPRYSHLMSSLHFLNVLFSMNVRLSLDFLTISHSVFHVFNCFVPFHCVVFIVLCLSPLYLLLIQAFYLRVLRIHTGRSSHSWLFFISRDGCVRSNLGMGNPGIALWRWKPNVTNQILTSTEKKSSGCGK